MFTNTQATLLLTDVACLISPGFVKSLCEAFGKGSVQVGPFTEAMQRRAAVPSLAPQGRLFTGETSDRCTIILQQQKTLPAKDQAAEAALVALSTSQSGL